MTIPPTGIPLEVPDHVTVVCTGRGAHRKLTIQVFSRWGGQWCVEHEQIRTPVHEQCAASDWPTPGLYPLRCRKCGRRDTKPNIKTLVKLLDGVALVGEVDLSYLPF